LQFRVARRPQGTAQGGLACQCGVGVRGSGRLIDGQKWIGGKRRGG
jgi:hypothetical protein